MTEKPEGFKNISNARPLLILGDTVTTDHISPAGSIKKDSPTGDYFHGKIKFKRKILTLMELEEAIMKL